MGLKDIRQLPEEEKHYYALAQISAVCDKLRCHGLGMAKLSASTFGRLRGGMPRVYSWRSSEWEVVEMV